MTLFGLQPPDLYSDLLNLFQIKKYIWKLKKQQQ